MKRREDERAEGNHLWDKTFEDNQDLDKEGNLSRTEHRKQSSATSRVTTILVVLIIILAAAPVLYWVNHEKSFSHPSQKTEQVASTTSSKKKASSKSASSASSKSSTKLSKGKSTTSPSSTNTSSTSTSASSSSSSTSASSSSAVYATVESGQGIYRVAVNNGLTVSELVKLNGISTTAKLYPGEKLRVR